MSASLGDRVIQSSRVLQTAELLLKHGLLDLRLVVEEGRFASVLDFLSFARPQSILGLLHVRHSLSLAILRLHFPQHPLRLLVVLPTAQCRLLRLPHVLNKPTRLCTLGRIKLPRGDSVQSRVSRLGYRTVCFPQPAHRDGRS